MYWKLFCVGLIFLFNPCVSVIDVLPDVLGCVLIVLSLRRAIHISTDIKECRTSFTKLGVVSIVNLISIVAISVLRTDDDGISLALCFGITVAEIIFLIAAFTDLFAGVSSLIMRMNSENSEKKAAFSHDCLILKIYTIAFFAVRQILCLLPELGYLVSEDDMLISGKTSFFTVNKQYLTIGSIAAGLVLGAVWLYLCFDFCNKLKSDSEFSRFTADEFVLYDPGERFWYSSSQQSAFTLCFAAGILLINIITDGKSMLPDSCSFALFFVSFLIFIKNKTQSGKAILAFPIMGSIFSMISWVCSMLFSGSYYAFGISILEYAPRASKLYNLTVIFQALSSVMMLICIMAVLSCYYTTVSKYLRSQSETMLSNEGEKSRKVRRKLYFEITLSAFLGIGVCICDFLYYVFLFSFTEFWMIDFGFTLLFALCFTTLSSNLKQEYKSIK